MNHYGSHDRMSRRSFVAGAAAAVGAPAFVTGTKRAAGPTLSLPPYLARPTRNSILIHARNGHDPVSAGIQIRATGSEEWGAVSNEIRAAAGEFLRWEVPDLEPATHYEYRIQMTTDAGDEWPIVRGDFTTQRAGDDSYVAALITDAHTGAFPDGGPELRVTDDVIRNVRRDRPEFVLALGDNVAWRTSRNEAQPNTYGAERAYTMYRNHTGPLTQSCPHFGLIGNWEGETGKFPDEAIEMVSGVRRRFAPNPNNLTYPEGGSPNEDYYAFTWGPVLYVILNVQGYTRPSGSTSSTRDDVLTVDDWTLGSQQFEWFERTLAGSSLPFKFVCIHHAVGGNAGNDRDTLYGRGGARAARVGEQRRVHELMREYGVQIMFYGHDHVFVDDIVDDIHYTLPGSFGAPWKFGRDITGYERFWTDSGHARLTVKPSQTRVEFVNQSGNVFHEFAVGSTRR